jgi:hypothetical protein
MSASSATSSLIASYDRTLADVVQRALAQGTMNFRDLLSAVDGADPSTVFSVLKRLAPTDQPLASAAQAAIAEAQTPLPATPTPLPIPHPLDYAWMFAESTQVQLLERMAALTVPGDLIAHLGTPTLHSRAMRVLPDRRHVLFDRDSRRIDAANALVADSAQNVDLLQQTPAALGAALAVADPPWYTQPAIAFTHAASVLLREDAQLLLAFPAGLTRPGILEERKELVKAVELGGMMLLGVESNALRYDTPAFERAAMLARGIPGTPEDWRLGDLLSLRRTSAPSPSIPFSHEQDWVAVEIDSIPLRARASSPPGGKSLIGRLVDGDVLATVSGRAPEREFAVLWTSRNRVYRSAEPSVLASILQDVADGLPITNDPEIKAAARTIAKIVELERHEHGLPTRDAPVPA